MVHWLYIINLYFPPKTKQAVERKYLEFQNVQRPISMYVFLIKIIVTQHTVDVLMK